MLQCLMDQLLTAEDDEGAAMPEQALRDELLTLLVAGQETSAVLLAWALAYLAHNPGWQQACAAQVRQQLQGSAPTADNIGCARLWPGTQAGDIAALAEQLVVSRHWVGSAHACMPMPTQV